MAEPLKNQFGPDVARKIAQMLSAQSRTFNAHHFVEECLAGYDALDLMSRGKQIARTLHHHLPTDYEEAVRLLIASLGPKLETTGEFGMAPFLYLPHVLFVAEFGLDHFEPSMHAQYELTQRFSAEFSIRPFLERHAEQTLARLKEWARDPSPHVRRLVSEGTRPRLPWAPRLRAFQKDPRPVLALLELLKDDPELYVRRSVANNLNDIGKDHPELLFATARRWQTHATPQRHWLITHALRSALKRAEPGALDVLGFGQKAQVRIGKKHLTPTRPAIGQSITITFEITNTDTQHQQVLANLRVHYVKANGQARPKVFRLKPVDLAPQACVQISKTLSLAQMTTRTHYPGTHAVEVVLNGVTRPLGTFELVVEES